MLKIAIFTATRWELNAIRQSFWIDPVPTHAHPKCIIGRSRQAHIYLFQTGIGVHKAVEVCRDALKGKRWDLVISTGYAAALTPSRVGAIVVADQVLPESSGSRSFQSFVPLPCHSGVSQKALEVGLSMAGDTKLGKIVTVQRIVNKAVDKQALAQSTGAIGLDMESSGVGKVANERQIPFVVVRGISDLMDEDLPEELNQFLGPFGWIHGLPSVLLSPRPGATFFDFVPKWCRLLIT